MRIAFLLALLAASLFYSYVAFVDLRFLSAAGRLGPGFFPRIIGVGLIVFTLMSLAADMRLARADDTASDYWGDVGIVVLFSVLFVLSLSYLGGIVATAVFLFVALSVLNRGRHLINAVLALLMPLGVYLLFDVALNAAVPEGMLPLPF